MYYPDNYYEYNFTKVVYPDYFLPIDSPACKKILFYDNNVKIGESYNFLFSREDNKDFWYIAGIESNKKHKNRLLLDTSEILLGITCVPIDIMVLLPTGTDFNKLMTQFIKVSESFKKLGFVPQPNFTLRYTP